MPVWQNLFLHRELVHRPLPFLARRRMRIEARRMLSTLGIDLVSIDVPAARLSGGERQAVAVARTLGSQARILLLDEPTAAMGVRESAAILEVLARLRERRAVSIVLVGHNPAQVLTFCDRVNVLEDGHVALDEPVATVRLDRLVPPLRARACRQQRGDVTMA